MDLRPPHLVKLPDLKQHLMISGDKGREDYDYFLGQLAFPQKSSMGGKDDKARKKEKERVRRQLTAAKYAERHQGEFSGTSPPPRRSIDPTMTISEANMIKSPRQCALAKSETTSSIFSSTESSQSSGTESEWETPLRVKRELSKKPEHLTLQLPAKKIPKLLAATSTSTKTSIRHELKIVSTPVEAGGGDIGDASLSVQTIHRQRKAATRERERRI